MKKIFQLLFKSKKRQNEEDTLETISEAIELATGEESSEQEKQLIYGIVKLRDTPVKQIMRSRPDISAISCDASYSEVLDFIAQMQFSRIPVYRESIDKIEGILHIKHLFSYRNEPDTFDWKKLIQPVEFIPETKKIDELLKYFQAKRLHMAMIVDEYGSTAGLVTLEDIIEEIVGEINDEFDDEDILFYKLDDKTYIFEAKIPINDFCRVLKIDSDIFDDVRGESESLGGLFLELNSDMPKPGDKINHDKYTFEVVAGDTKKISKVKVYINDKVYENNNEE